MNSFSLHTAPNAPWWALVLAALALLALALWAYRFVLPPLAAATRAALTTLRALALVALVFLLAQPVLERALPSSGARLTLLLDASASMDLPASRGGPTRRAEAEARVRELTRALRGRAQVETRRFATGLAPDSGRVSPDATALGDALGALAERPLERRPDGVIVVSDGAVNAGADPVASARAIGVPVHTVPIGAPLPGDRAVAEIEASTTARAGEATPVLVHVRSDEPRGTPIGVRVLDDGRVLASTSVPAPGSGADVVARLRVTPSRPGLAVWTAAVDSIAGDPARTNDARELAIDVAPGRLGVLLLSSGLNWDLTFLRRALLADSTLRLDTRVRDAGGWRALERRGGSPAPVDLRDVSVVVLDATAPEDAGPAFAAALASFVRAGGGLLAIGGPAPGLLRYGRGVFARELGLPDDVGYHPVVPPSPRPAGADLLAWDDDPARGAEAWRSAAPLADVLGWTPVAGEQVLLGGGEDGRIPLLVGRRVGRGPVLLLNGSGTWRWSLSAQDPLQVERGRRLWQRLVRWLAEPVQAEPLRVRPERWLVSAGEPVRLLATLQDSEFRPLAGATIAGEARNERGQRVPLAFSARGAGSYVATPEGLEPGRWEVSATARLGAREVGRARSGFAVDRWSIEALGSQPDSATLAAVAAASGGRVASTAAVGPWARSLPTRALVRARLRSSRLWESPWWFAAVVAALSLEWAWRRRRGLP